MRWRRSQASAGAGSASESSGLRRRTCAGSGRQPAPHPRPCPSPRCGLDPQPGRQSSRRRSANPLRHRRARRDTDIRAPAGSRPRPPDIRPRGPTPRIAGGRCPGCRSRSHHRVRTQPEVPLRWRQTRRDTPVKAEAQRAAIRTVDGSCFDGYERFGGFDVGGRDPLGRKPVGVFPFGGQRLSAELNDTELDRDLAQHRVDAVEALRPCQIRLQSSCPRLYLATCRSPAAVTGLLREGP